MAQWSAVWDGTTTGDAAGSIIDAPYTEDEWSDLWDSLFTYDRTAQGVIQTNRSGYTGLLEVTNPSGSTIRVANGLAMVDGKLYGNTANVDNTVATPGAGNTNYYTVVLDKDFSAQTVRISLLGPSTAGYPSVTQTDGTTWEVEIGRVSVTDAGVITVTDRREFVRALSRQAGGSLLADEDGNARGELAVDLQQRRTSGSQVASGAGAFIAAGRQNTASGDYSHAEGDGNTASGAGSHAEGNGTTASNDNAHTEGNGTTASGADAHAEGEGTVASGAESHAEGYQTEASGAQSHAEGSNTVANSVSSHAEGEGATASGFYSHAEGQDTTASGTHSHAEGYLSQATAGGAHAEGATTLASGEYSHAEGIQSVAARRGSAAFSSGMIATAGDAQGSRFVCADQITHSDTAWHDIPISGIGTTAQTRMILAADTVWTFDVLIVGTTAGCGKSFGFRIEGVIENDGGTTAMLAQTVTTLYDTDDTSFDAQIAADDTNDAMKVQVQDTDGASDVVNWVAVVRTAEVTYPAP